MLMRTKLPGLIFALTFASPALAGGSSGCGSEASGCAPTLPYAWIDPTAETSPRLVYAAMAEEGPGQPVILAAIASRPDGGEAMARDDGGFFVVSAAIPSDDPVVQRLPGLVAIAPGAPARDATPPFLAPRPGPPHPRPAPPAS
jgi:hypothetical protein